MYELAYSLKDLEETFEFITDWDDRYQFLIELGEKLPTMAPTDHIDEYLVKECMSQVWIKPQFDPDHPARIILYGDSDSSTTKGLVAMLVTLYHGKTPEEIEATDTDGFFTHLGLFEHLSPTRHVGTYAMDAKIRKLVHHLSSNNS